MYVFCCGMHRSGSTWQYMVASHLVETRKGGKRVGLLNDEREFLEFDRAARRFDGWQTLKMHTWRPVFGQALSDGRAIGIYSYRDLRDVVFSLITMKNETFDEYVVQKHGVQTLIDNDTFWRAQPNNLIQSYEDITQRSGESVSQIARHLQIPLEPGEAEKIAAQFSVEENKKRAGMVAGERKKIRLFRKQRSFDPDTLLHWNHIQNGRIGRWRESATPEQIQRLAQACGAWLIERGFEKDMEWAKAPAASRKQS